MNGDIRLCSLVYNLVKNRMVWKSGYIGGPRLLQALSTFDIVKSRKFF